MPGVNLPKVPEGLRDLMKSLTKEVLREKPQNLYEFSANYFDSMLEDKKDFVFKGYEPVSTMKNSQRHPVPLSLVYSIIPAELTALIKEFIKAVLKANPPNICEFAVEYFRGILTNSDVNINTIQYNAYENYVMNKSFGPNIKCFCGRSFGNVLLTSSGEDTTKCESDIDSRNSTAEASHEGKRFSFIDSYKEDPNNKSAQSLTVLYTTEKYINATYVIQKHFRRYLLTKRKQNTQISEETAAIIIQRTLRKLFTKSHSGSLVRITAVNQMVTPKADASTHSSPGIMPSSSADTTEGKTVVPIETAKQPTNVENVTNNDNLALNGTELSLVTALENESNSPDVVKEENIGENSDNSALNGTELSLVAALENESNSPDVIKEENIGENSENSERTKRSIDILSEESITANDGQEIAQNAIHSFDTVADRNLNQTPLDDIAMSTNSNTPTENSERTRRSIDILSEESITANDAQEIAENAIHSFDTIADRNLNQKPLELKAVADGTQQMDEANSSAHLENSEEDSTAIEDPEKYLGHQKNSKIGGDSETENLQTISEANLGVKSVDLTLDVDGPDAENNDSNTERFNGLKEGPEKNDQESCSRTDESTEFDNMRTNNEETIQNEIEIVDSNMISKAAISANEVLSSPETLEDNAASQNVSLQNDKNDIDLMVDEANNADTKMSSETNTSTINCKKAELYIENEKSESKNSSHEKYDISDQNLASTRDGTVSENDSKNAKDENMQNPEASFKTNHELASEKEPLSPSTSPNEENASNSRHQIAEKGASNETNNTNLNSEEKSLQALVIEESVISNCISPSNNENSNAAHQKDGAPDLEPTSHESQVMNIDSSLQAGEEEVVPSKIEMRDTVNIGISSEDQTDSTFHEELITPDLVSEAVAGESRAFHGEASEEKPSPEVNNNSEEHIKADDPENRNNDHLDLSEVIQTPDKSSSNHSDTDAIPGGSDLHLSVAGDNSSSESTVETTLNEGDVLQTHRKTLHEEEIESETLSPLEELGSNVQGKTVDSSSHLQYENVTIEEDDMALSKISESYEQQNENYNEKNAVSSSVENESNPPANISESSKNNDTPMKNESESAEAYENLDSKTQNENTKSDRQLNEEEEGIDTPSTEKVPNEATHARSPNKEEMEIAEKAIGSALVSNDSALETIAESRSNADNLEPKKQNDLSDIIRATTQKDTIDPSGIAYNEKLISGDPNIISQSLDVDSAPEMGGNDNLNDTCEKHVEEESKYPSDNRNSSNSSTAFAPELGDSENIDHGKVEHVSGTHDDTVSERCEVSDEIIFAINEQVNEEANASDMEVPPKVDNQGLPFSQAATFAHAVSNQLEQATATDQTASSEKVKADEKRNTPLEGDNISTLKSDEAPNKSISDGNDKTTELDVVSILKEKRDVNTSTPSDNEHVKLPVSNDEQTKEKENTTTETNGSEEQIDQDMNIVSFQNIEKAGRTLNKELLDIGVSDVSSQIHQPLKEDVTEVHTDMNIKPENTIISTHNNEAGTQSVELSALEIENTTRENPGDGSDIEISEIIPDSRSKRSIEKDIETLSPPPIGTQNSHRSSTIVESIGTNFYHQILNRDGIVSTEVHEKTQRRIVPTEFLETYPNRSTAEVYASCPSNHFKESDKPAKNDSCGKTAYLYNYPEKMNTTGSNENTSKSSSHPERMATYLYGVHIARETAAHAVSTCKSPVTFFVPFERSSQNTGKILTSIKKSEAVTTNNASKSIPLSVNKEKNVKTESSSALPKPTSENSPLLGKRSGGDSLEITYEQKAEITTKSSNIDLANNSEPAPALDTIFEINEFEADCSGQAYEKEPNALQSSNSSKNVTHNSTTLLVSNAGLQEISCDSLESEMISQPVSAQEPREYKASSAVPKSEWESQESINEPLDLEDLALLTNATVKIQKWFRRLLTTTRIWEPESDILRKHFYQCGNQIDCGECLVWEKSVIVIQRAFRRYLVYKEVRMYSLSRSDVTDLCAAQGADEPGLRAFDRGSALDMSAQTDSSSLQSQDTAIFNGSYSENLDVENFSSIQTTESKCVVTDSESQYTVKNWYIGNEPIRTAKTIISSNSDTAVSKNLKINCPAPTSLKFTTSFDENPYCYKELNNSDEIISAENISEIVTQTENSEKAQSNDLEPTEAEGQSDRIENDIGKNVEGACITGNLDQEGDLKNSGIENKEESTDLEGFPKAKEIMVPGFDSNKNNIIVAISEFLKHEKSFCESCEEDRGNLCPDKCHEEIGVLLISSNKTFSQPETISLDADNEQGNENKSEREFNTEYLSDESLSNVTEKLQETNRTIEKMQLRQASETSIHSVEEKQARIKERNFEEPDIRPLKALESTTSQPSDEEEVVVSHLQRDETRESTGQSDSIVFGESNETKENHMILSDIKDVDLAKKPLKRLHTVAVSDSKTLLKSVTIDETIKYIEPCETETTNTSGNSFCLDDDTSENIRQKMMAYSLSEADSDYFQAGDSEMGVSMDKKTYYDDFNISTALGDTIGTSTDTESTIVSAVTKIQAGARSYLTRKRLRGSGTKSSSQGESKASFGNEAINESLEQLIEEEAAKKIQKAYRRHYKQTRTMDIVEGSHDYDSLDSGSFLSTSRENSLAARRLTLQRGDALRNDSNPDEDAGGTDGKERDEKKYLASASDIKKRGLDTSTVATAGTAKAIKLSDYNLKWFAMRQNSMPVQIDSEILRVIPKHMRKRIKSAEGVKKARRNVPKD